MWNGRPGFQRALCRLQNDVLGLGAMVYRAIEHAMVALADFDRIEARLIVDDDRQVNQERVRIEEQAIELIADSATDGARPAHNRGRARHRH